MFTKALAGGLLALASLAAQAQGYPSQTVRIIVGFPPGGTTDVIGRLVAQELTESLGKAVVVENRPGASGTIGGGLVAKSAPDGHTLLVVSSTHGTAPALYSTLPYEEKDLVPAALVATTPYVLVVHPSMAATNMAQLLAYLKQNPGKIEYASSSPGTAQHLAGELVQRMAGVNIVHIPYKGSGALLPDLLAGRVPMMFENVAIMTPHIKKGSLRPIAVSSAKRTLLLPDVPTVLETLPSFRRDASHAVMAPAKTPRAIVYKVSRDVARVIDMPDVRKQMDAMDFVPAASTPEEFDKILRGMLVTFDEVAKAAGLKSP